MKNLVTAMVSAARSMPQLAKSDTNQYGGYAYVPIDRFYEVVAPILYENGLCWTVGETNPPEIIGEGKGAIIVFSYNITLMHVSGETHSAMVSVPHPWQGAQTSGSAMSYAVKSFLRSTFALVTGEPDADNTNPAAAVPQAAQARSGPSMSQAAPKRPPAGGPPPPAGGTSPPKPVTSSGEVTQAELEPILDHYYDGNLPVLIDPQDDPSFPWAVARDVFQSIAPYVSEYPRFAEWCRLNIKVVEGMKKHDPASYEVFTSVFEERRKALLRK